MKSFRDQKRIALFTALLILGFSYTVLAHPEDKDRWDNKYDTEDYLF